MTVCFGKTPTPREKSSIFVNNYCIKYHAMQFQCPVVVVLITMAVGNAVLRLNVSVKSETVLQLDDFSPSPSAYRHPLSYRY